ncbi:hypothetical protein [Lentibacillus salinarum]|uniref:Cytochrome c oxidase subunit 2A n=1 Tax=Lentibacillus salinarum TaxID=446820 RepID=A0ABW3ZUB9_9BACI
MSSQERTEELIINTEEVDTVTDVTKTDHLVLTVVGILPFFVGFVWFLVY